MVTHGVRPRARREGIVVQELPDETLLYDVERNRASCLGPAAAAVWARCDGRTTVAGLARVLHAELGIEADEDVVWAILARLSRSHLLTEPVVRPPDVPALSRRDMLRRAGVGGAAALLPLVASVVVPSAAFAATQCTVNACENGTAAVGCCCIATTNSQKGKDHKTCVVTGTTRQCNGPAC